MHRSLRLAFALVATCALLAGCGDDGGGIAVVTTPEGTLAPGAEATYGVIDRLPGGTAVIRSDYTIATITCDAGVLRITTSGGAFTGGMDCATMPSDDVISLFTGKTVQVTITPARIRIDSPEVGSLDFPASEGKLE